MSSTYQDVLNELANIDHTVLLEDNNLERIGFTDLAKLSVWMERRKPFITVAQCDRYHYYYETFLLKTIKSLSVDYINWVLNKKTFSEAEIKEHIELCTETIKDLNKHTKLISAEVKHIKKWFYAEMQFKSKNPILEETRQLLINLYEYLENANEHKLTLFYLKDFYTAGRLSNVEQLKNIDIINTQIDELLTPYKAGLNLIGEYISEGKIGQWVNKIERQSNKHKELKANTKIFKTEMENIYKECQSISQNFNKAITIWENNNVEDNLRNMTEQLAEFIYKLDEDSIDFSCRYYKFCAEELTFALSKIEKAPELAESADDLVVELRNILEQVEVKLEREAQKNVEDSGNRFTY